MIEVVTEQVRWRAGGGTSRGPSHIAADLPNQDAIAWNTGNGSDAPLVLAVSDGHGSPNCFRSDAGSRFSVETALEVLAPITAVPDEQGARRLAMMLVNAWQARVDSDIKARPYSESERARLSPAPEDNRLPYGATMLTVLVRQDFVLFAQIGDGDILCVDASGKTSRVFTKDAGLAINETRSLCETRAWEEVHVHVIDARAQELPALILVSTDGYVNSFASENDFLMIGRDFREMIRGDGLEAVVRELPAILRDTTRAGSQDDITIGLIKRIEDPSEDGPPLTLAVERETPRKRKRRGRSPEALLTIAATLLALAAGVVLGYFGARYVHPQSPRPHVVRAQSANALVLSARAAVQRGDYVSALKLYQRATAIDPSDAVLQRERATLILRVVSSMPAVAAADHINWNAAVQAWSAVVALDGDTPNVSDLDHLRAAITHSPPQPLTAPPPHPQSEVSQP